MSDLWQDVFRDSPVGMARVGLDGRFLSSNRKLTETLGLPVETLTRMGFQEITHPEDLCADQAQVDRLLSRGRGSYGMLKRYMRPDGSHVWAQLNVSLVQTPQGDPNYFVSIIQEASAETSHLDQLQQRATHDPLTTLLNRQALEDALAELQRTSMKSGRPFAIIILDLDGFKSVNDRLGHLAGDALLAQIGQRLKEALGTDERAARFGGDEFMLLLPDARDQATVGRMIGRIYKIFAKPFAINAEQLRLTASIGHAVYPDFGHSLRKTIEIADARMLAQKRQRYCRIC